jgi:hypothetical protein
MDPFELAHEIAMDYQRWFVDHMFDRAGSGLRCAVAAEFQGISTAAETREP